MKPVKVGFLAKNDTSWHVAFEIDDVPGYRFKYCMERKDNGTYGRGRNDILEHDTDTPCPLCGRTLEPCANSLSEKIIGELYAKSRLLVTFNNRKK